MKRRFAPAFFSVLFFFPVLLYAAPGCQTVKCHEGILKQRFTHEGAEDDSCDDCHSSNGAEHPAAFGKEFKLESDVPELCLDCHEVDLKVPDLHDPVAEGECTECHNPHSSRFPKLLTGKKVMGSCDECHDKGNEDMKWVHGPTAAGACISCHNPHAASGNFLLRQKGAQLCYECHEEKQAEFAAMPQHHTPVDSSCTLCHDPHKSNERFFLKAPEESFCFSCHEKVRDIVGTSSTQHDAVTLGKQCSNCHDPHGSRYSSNLLDKPLAICLNCHDKPMASDGGKLSDMKSYLKDNPDHHGPIREESCTGCHDPHGSNYTRLLKDGFPHKFYAPFQKESYALCFSCHEEQLVLEEKSANTGFRNGEQNLHFLHVNRSKKGRTCRACHDMHASKQSFHIRESVPFGSFDLPINFEPAPNGGSCSPGCHSQKDYKR